MQNCVLKQFKEKYNTKVKEKFEKFIINLNLKNCIAIIIFVLDLIAFFYDFFINFAFSNFSNFDRLAFCGLLLCLFLDCFLWGEKEFLGLQIIKIFILFINQKFSMSCLGTLFFWSLGLYCYDSCFLQNKKNKPFFLFI